MLVSKTFLSPTPLFQPKSLKNSDTKINMEQFEEDLGALIAPSPPDPPPTTFFPFSAKNSLYRHLYSIPEFQITA